MHIITFIVTHAVNSQIIFTWVNFNSIKLSHTIKHKRNMVVKQPINIDDFNIIGPGKRTLKRSVVRIKNVNIDDIDRIIP